jgi:hypothetical protein
MPGSAQEKAAAAPTEDQAFCKKCGAGGSVNIVPNWHDKVRSCCAIHQALETMSPWLVKLTADRPYADPEKAARRMLEIANAVEPIQGRIHIEKINEPFLFRDRGSPAEYGAGLKLAIERGWLKMHESGTFVTFTPAGAELFA